MTQTTVTREQFEQLVLEGGDFQSAREATRALRAGEPDAPFRVAAHMLFIPTSSPESLVDVYDGLTEGWLGRRPEGPRIDTVPLTTPVPTDVWAAIWDLALDPDAGNDPGDITVRTAAITGLQPATLHARVAATARTYPDVSRAAAGGIPAKFRFEEIAACPAGSLGDRLRSLVEDKGFDLEVLDRDELGLTEMPAPLDYLNVRILQCHDIWHEVAGYETTALHEVAVSAFQMAQFGHHYSSMFLGVVATKVAFTQPYEAVGFISDIILSAYTHGRETPPLVGVEWEQIWALPMDEVRANVGVTPYASPYPADILSAAQG